jgi:O-antigen/teichoic acid export membrane protein
MKEVGIFSAAQRPVLIAASVALPLASSFYPLICQSYVDPERFRESQALFQHVVLVLTIPAAILGAANGDYVMHVLYGNSYLQAHGLFRIMSLVIPLSAMRLTYTHPLLASHRQSVAAAIAFKAGVATALLVYVFFRAFGLMGAAWAIVLGEVLFMALATMYAYRLLRIPPYTPACGPIVLGACLMVIPMLVPGPRALCTIVAAGVYAAVILGLDGLGKEMLMAVVNRITKSSIGEGTVA